MRDLVKTNVKIHTSTVCQNIDQIHDYALDYYDRHKRVFNKHGIDAIGLIKKVNQRYVGNSSIYILTGFKGINLGRLVTFRNENDVFYTIRCEIMANENK